MDYRVDEKGKVYTQHVSKLPVPVIVRVEDALIHGTVHLTPGNRLKDELNGDEAFIAITQVKVSAGASQRPLFETEVLILNKQRITWIYPSEPES